jgi:rhodanese-related sulfurtransferase
MAKLKTSVAEMVEKARAGIAEISTDEGIAMLGDPNVLIVDIRDVRERQRDGYIPGSFHCPRGMVEFWVDPQSPYYKEVFGEDRKFVFHCASGWRSALTVATLQEMGFEAAHLEKGFSDWKKQGGPVEFRESPKG